MRLLVDGDSSGHRDLIKGIARETKAELVWVHNPSHQPPSPEEGLSLTVHLADAGPQGADILLMNFARPEDIVVTGDLGLAMVCVAKGAAAISPRGFWYRAEEFQIRSEFRALAARLKRGGEYLHRKPKSVRLDDWRFESELRRALGADASDQA